MSARRDVYAEIDAERARQDAKWGDQARNSMGLWLAVLMEEVGELATDCLPVTAAPAIDAPRGFHARTELVQIAAVAVAWLEAMA